MNKTDFLKMKENMTAGRIFTSKIMRTPVKAPECRLTPQQAEGPFYPGGTHLDRSTDLTQVPGQSRAADGQIIYLTGRVADELSKPVANARIEIWQACASGKYNNPRDPNLAPLDPNFRYWAETSTSLQGEYSFKTIMPGTYPAAQGWTRPPHIHFKVSKPGYEELITQMYFRGHHLNDEDLILKQIPQNQRSLLIIEFTPALFTLERDSLIGDFAITLKTINQKETI